MSLLEHHSLTKLLWTSAVLLFGIGDFVTTLYFIDIGLAAEGHPVIASAIDTFGLWVLAPWKAAAIAGFYGLNRLVPDEIAVGVPIGLSLIGLFLTSWNTLGAYLGQNPLPIF